MNHLILWQREHTHLDPTSSSKVNISPAFFLLLFENKSNLPATSVEELLKRNMMTPQRGEFDKVTSILTETPSALMFFTYHAQ